MEEQRLALADAVFAPGPFVSESTRVSSPANIKFLETSYGAYVPDAIPRKSGHDRRMRFLFVGSFGVRKGAPTLLDAWEKADIDAELIIVGKIEPQVQAQFDALQDERLRYVGYRKDIEAVYAQSDVLVFPSLEEGGPQVTYEAAGYAMPSIVTAMGGGRIADDSNAIIVPDSNCDALAAALVRLGEDRELTQTMGHAARKAAMHFDWHKVSKQRLTLLENL